MRTPASSALKKAPWAAKTPPSRSAKARPGKAVKGYKGVKSAEKIKQHRVGERQSARRPLVAADFGARGPSRPDAGPNSTRLLVQVQSITHVTHGANEMIMLTAKLGA